MAGADALAKYRVKRNFSVTPEPSGGDSVAAAGFSFVIQKHWATRLHYDFRLELDGSMKSWAVPKGPSLDPHVKRMAVEVEDHPIAYAAFEGRIPDKEYGAGTVIIWDRGIWTPAGDPQQGYRDGNLKFTLEGEKLQGKWALIRIKSASEKQQPWLLIKEKDAFVRDDAEYRVVDALPDSVMKSGAADQASVVASTRKQPVDPAIGDHPTKGLPAAAIKCALPKTLAPQLATLAATAPANAASWLYELKFDGYRLLARIDGAAVTFLTRTGQDWTARLPHLQKALAGLQMKSGWLDGEIVVADRAGVPDFQALQNAFDGAATQDIVFYLFDLPYYDGHDLRSVPLVQRRALLESILAEAASHDDISAALRFSEAFDVPGAELLASACKLGFEGVIGKRRDSPYASRRSKDWIKLKCGQRQEFVIGGYTDPKGTRQGFGALLLGVHDAQGRLQYVGNVGTGFDANGLTILQKQLVGLSAPVSPFANKTGIDRSAHWVRPQLVAEVAFSAWTAANRLRHAVFHALRSDKPAQDVMRDTVATDAPRPAQVAAVQAARPSGAKPSATQGRRTPALPATLRVTHPDKIIDRQSGATKIEVIRYYATVAPLMLPHLAKRPTALVRAPDGVAGQLFFQKHAEHAAMAGIVLLDRALDPGHAPLLKVALAEGLLSAAQMNVLEFHTWNALEDAITKPDRMCFDLDPGAGVEWPAICEAATLVREMLHQLGLASYVKTSGGKGLHVVVPLKRRYGWETVKDFSHAIVDHLAATIPQRFVAKSGPANRVGKVFGDYLRNGFGATTAAAWSVRSRPGLGVSVPIAWDELSGVTGGAHWNLANIHTRLDLGNAPWADYANAAQNLTQAMRRLGFATPK